MFKNRGIWGDYWNRMLLNNTVADIIVSVTLRQISKSLCAEGRKNPTLAR